MIVMTTNNGDVGIRQAVDALKSGKTATDAIEVGIREVELHRPDRSVGLHGYPNILGYPELDALIMDGRTRNVGAVGAVKGYDGGFGREIGDKGGCNEGHSSVYDGVRSAFIK